MGLENEFHLTQQQTVSEITREGERNRMIFILKSLGLNETDRKIEKEEIRKK